MTKPRQHLRSSIFAFAAVAALLVLITGVKAQRRDFVTEPESELIREYQEIDMRVDAITKMIDRRLAAAKIPGATWTVPKKQDDMWGPEPEGTRIELLSDVKRLLQKAIDDIDDIASRSHNSVPENDVGGKLFPKAVRTLAAAAARYKPIFDSEAAKAADQREKGLLLASEDLCDQIIEAAANLPPEETKAERKKKKTEE